MQSDIIDIEFRSPPNLGVLTCRLPLYVVDEIKVHIDNVCKNNFQNSNIVPANANLAGHLQHEYKLPNLMEKLEPLLVDLSNQYNDRFNLFDTIGTHKGNTTLKLTELWVNFQKKHEFNPVHHHTGVISFVIWISIPYNLAEEDAVFSEVDSGKPQTSKFMFHYTNILGKQSNLPLSIDKSWEGILALFPAQLSHSVNPFYTSDDYRISVAGNLSYVFKD
jgi:hypothetical protein